MNVMMRKIHAAVGPHGKQGKQRHLRSGRTSQEKGRLSEAGAEGGEDNPRRYNTYKCICSQQHSPKTHRTKLAELQGER